MPSPPSLRFCLFVWAAVHVWTGGAQPIVMWWVPLVELFERVWGLFERVLGLGLGLARVVLWTAWVYMMGVCGRKPCF